MGSAPPHSEGGQELFIQLVNCKSEALQASWPRNLFPAQVEDSSESEALQVSWQRNLLYALDEEIAKSDAQQESPALLQSPEKRIAPRIQ